MRRTLSDEFAHAVGGVKLERCRVSNELVVGLRHDQQETGSGRANCLVGKATMSKHFIRDIGTMFCAVRKELGRKNVTDKTMKTFKHRLENRIRLFLLEEEKKERKDVFTVTAAWIKKIISKHINKVNKKIQNDRTDLLERCCFLLALLSCTSVVSTSCTNDRCALITSM